MSVLIYPLCFFICQKQHLIPLHNHKSSKNHCFLTFWRLIWFLLSHISSIFLRISTSPSSPIPVFETQVKCWNVYQDHSNDFRHFLISAERGTTFRIWRFSLTWQPGPCLSRQQFLDSDFSVTAGDCSKERKSKRRTRIKVQNQGWKLLLPFG